MEKFIERHISKEITENIKLYPAISVEGPRQSGKTTLLKSLFPDYSYADLDDSNIRLLAFNDPYEFFRRYPEPVIIDEAQRCPDLLSMVKVRIDQNRKPGQYVISGSSQVTLRKAVSESLAGRSAILRMYPFSLSELEEAGINLDRDTQLITGFLPYIYSHQGISPYSYYDNYLQTYIERDIYRENNITDKLRFETFLRVLAGRVGQLVDFSSIGNDVGVSSTTIKNWISLLSACYLIYILPSWQKNRVSRAVKSPKIYFADTGLLSALLEIRTPEQMLRDPLRGNIFENMVIMEAVKTRTEQNGSLPFYFFRNSRGEEVDLLMERTHALRLYEIKSAEAVSTSFFSSMKYFEEKNGMEIEEKNLIYAGEDGKLQDVNLIDFHHISRYIPKEEKFIFHL